MNFTTDLPKKDPIVSYIVASAVQCDKFFPEAHQQGPVFRMHAVTLIDKRAHQSTVQNPQELQIPSDSTTKVEGGFANQKQDTDLEKIHTGFGNNLGVSGSQPQKVDNNKKMTSRIN